MNRTIFIFLSIFILVSGCMGSDTTFREECDGNIPSDYYWADSYQWNNFPMSYANMTVWELNNTSTPNLFLNISVMSYFSEEVLGLERGFFNLSLYENDTLLWTDETQEAANWSFSLDIKLNETFRWEIQSQGKDTHPESEYGDFFIVEIYGVTYSPTICKVIEE